MNFDRFTKGVSKTASPTTYRVLFLDPVGRIDGTEAVTASCDGRVLVTARAKVRRTAVEVWDGLRLVDRFEPKE